MAGFGNPPPVKQSIVTLDMEGVLTPEIWIAVAEKTGIKELRRTTRDEPDYDVLMRGRLKILDQHGLKLSDIQQVIGTLQPLPGAKEFLDELRSLVQVDRKSTRLNSSHLGISYAVFCLKKKNI